MADPTTIYGVVEDVLRHVQEALDALLPEEQKFDRVYVVNGPPSLDGYEEEECAQHLVAWAEAVLPTDNFPAPPSRAVLCTPPAQAIAVVVQTIRCEPVLTAEGFPYPEELAASARAVYLDAQIVWDALVCYALTNGTGEDAEGEHRDCLLVGGVPIEPNGGVVGWETRIQVEVDACGPCGPHVPIPDGYLDVQE